MSSTNAIVETSHASPEAVATVTAYFRSKSRRDVDATIAHFSKERFAYIDATLGLEFPSWEGLRDLFAQQLPSWPAGASSYVTRVVGDETSAVVCFANDPGIFFPADMRAISVVNFLDGKIARWIDYWDTNHIGAANLIGFRHADSEFPADFKESVVGDVAADRIKEVAASLNQAFAAGDAAGAAALFSKDATFVDLTAHVHLTGSRHITSFLAAAKGTLPYLGDGTEVRHVVGSAVGGGYEWTATGAVRRGVNVLELDEQGLITRFESIWDGSHLDDDALLRLAKAAIER
ncbi:nuclear transport factor 2 family protein [Umezawaea sp. NPDC059074]|uniref:nuclear transport factor 2 family protein n=1 Tax=Umezawaea sp. NPDC059074 TaxID=3346716 RepID=UPI0036B68D41